MNGEALGATVTLVAIGASAGILGTSLGLSGGFVVIPILRLANDVAQRKVPAFRSSWSWRTR